ncbi:hypothetical protein IR073_06330 [Gemella sp. 19428wG2_WT2a]|nr:hypothetical protein [Gemella sp. 19428wG2_WT2a]TFU57843.1 hypothetical protein E4T67_06260 [Gemella sp. WT2a]
MKYSWEATNYYLNNFERIREELNLFLVTSNTFEDLDENIGVVRTKMKNSTEQALLRKLNDGWYIRRKHAVNCVKQLFKEMDDEIKEVMICRYLKRESIVRISQMIHRSESSVEKMIYRQKQILYKKLNSTQVYGNYGKKGGNMIL